MEVGDASKRLSEFLKDEIRELLSQCTAGQQTLFERLHGKVENIKLDFNDAMLQQLERTVIKNIAKRPIEEEKEELPKHKGLTLEECSKLIGKKVEYVSFENESICLSETGVITSVNHKYVFVRYGTEIQSKATLAEFLRLEEEE